jgi:hypothetical protein
MKEEGWKPEEASRARPSPEVDLAKTGSYKILADAF